MKKGNRVLAMFLVAVMLVTSIAWDFSGAREVEAADSTGDAVTEHVKYDFLDPTTMDTLDTDFISYLGATTTVPSEKWFIGATSDEEGVTASNVVGLKPKDRGNTYNLVSKQKYEDYKVTIEIYPDTNTMVAVGNVPTDGNNVANNATDGFKFWFSGSKSLTYGGMGKSNASKTLTTSSDVYTLNIRKENSKLTVWIDEVNKSEFYLEYTDISFPTESFIALRQKRNTDGGKNGGFKSLEIHDLNAEGYYDFEYVDVTTLNTAFTSTQLDEANSNAILEGEQDQNVEKHWTSDATMTSANAKKDFVGIKPQTVRNIANGKGYQNLLKYNETYKNFELSVELTWGTNIGIVLGDTYTFPAADTKDAILISPYTSETAYTKLRVRGAVDTSTSSIKGTLAEKTDSSSTVGLFKVSETTMLGQTERIHIKMEERVLTLWVEGYDEVYSIKVADTYSYGTNISLWALGYDNDISFRDFQISSLDSQHVKYDFLDSVTMDALDTDFISYLGATTTVPSEKWFIGATSDEEGVIGSNVVGLKPKDRGNTYNLVSKQKYEDYKVTIEIYPDTNTMVAVGNVPTDGTNVANNATDGFKFWFSGSRSLTYGGMGKSNASKTLTTSSDVYTLNIRKENSKLTVWIDEVSQSEFYLEYTDISFPTESFIALRQKRNNDTTTAGKNGGFKSLEIHDLNAEGYYDFEYVDVTTLNTAFTSTQLDEANSNAILEKDQNVEKHWTSDATKKSSNAKKDFVGIKPQTVRNIANGKGYQNLLKYNETYKNFELSVELTWGTNIGIVLGDTYTFPAADTKNAILISPHTSETAYTKLRVRGAVDTSTSSIKGTLAEKTDSSSTVGLFKVSETTMLGQTERIHIKMEERVLTLWVEGYDEVYSVNVADTYPFETNISLWALGYDNDISFKDFFVDEVQTPGNNGAIVNEDRNGARYTDFDKVNVSILEQEKFSASRYDASNNFKVEDTEPQLVSKYWVAGYDVASSNTGLKPNSVDTENKITLLNTPYSYEDFRISTEVYWGANTGIVLGEKNVYPTSTTDTGIRIFFNSGGRIQVVGAGFDPETVLVSGGAVWNPNGGTYLFKPNDDFAATKGDVYKLNIEMKDNVFTAWVDGYDGSLTFKMVDTFKNESIALMAKQYDGNGGGFKSLTVQELSDIVIPYKAAEFATYRNEINAAGEYTSLPTYQNYLFAGWFKDTSCTKEQAVSVNEKTIEQETVYAKFVPKYILTVKAQVSAELTDANLQNDQMGTIRFATTVDTLNYSRVGFKVSYDKDGDGTALTVTSASNKVYEQLNAIGGITYEPTDFCDSSIYFKACNVKNIGENFYDLDFEITSFWKTLDGTVVNGDTVVKTIDQGINVGYLNKKTALFIGDSIQYGGGDKPANDYYNMAWAGRLDRYYNMSVEKVAVSGATLTNSEVSGAEQIIKQLDGVVGEDFNFVMLEGGVNDLRKMTLENKNTITWGTINEDPNAIFTDDNIAGAIQNLIRSVKSKYANAKVIYIINHNFGITSENMDKYVSLVKAACRVHNIFYVDLSDIEAYPTLTPLATPENEYLVDTHHPNAAGYELTTPVIADYMRKLESGELVNTVYVASTGIDAKGYGTESEPYGTLNYAISQVADGGTILVKDEYTLASDFVWEEHGKNITIAGNDDPATLSFANVLNGTSTTINVRDNVTFSKIILAFTADANQGVMANGHDFIVEEDVTFTGKSIRLFGGGSNNLVVDRTYLELHAGNYTEIYGGGSSGTVKNDTNIIIGSKVNQSVDYTSHDETSYLMFGGVRNGTVKGDTHITVMKGANFHCIFGGSRDGGSVEGSTNIKFAGNTYGIYGGSWKGAVANTNVEVLDGNVHQLFGGCRETSMSGNVNVVISGGKILRRVFGGCYNEHNTSTTYYVDGITTVTIEPEVQFVMNEGDTQSLAAISRHKTPSTNEKGIFIFNDYNSNLTNISKIGIDGILTSWYGFGSKTHDHIVKVDANGTVKVVDGKLVVIPNDGYEIQEVTGATSNEDGTYAMTSENVLVTFQEKN